MALKALKIAFKKKKVVTKDLAGSSGNTNIEPEIFIK
jgi:hypothetical protein